MQVALALQQRDLPWAQLARMLNSAFESLTLRGHLAHFLHRMLCLQAPDDLGALVDTPLMKCLLGLARTARHDYQLRGCFGALAVLLQHEGHLITFLEFQGLRVATDALGPPPIGTVFNEFKARLEHVNACKLNVQPSAAKRSTTLNASGSIAPRRGTLAANMSMHSLHPPLC